MARSRRAPTTGRQKRATPAGRSKRFTAAPERLYAPMIDWSGGAAPTAFDLPSIKELSGLDVDGLSQVLERFGVAGTWPAARAAAAGYVQRMSMMPPGSDAFNAAMENLIDVTSKRGALSMARRTYRDLSTLEALDGDAEIELIRVCEQDERSCDNCRKLGGYIGTYAEHAAIGLPGSESCDGGDFCRCQLVRIM